MSTMKKTTIAISILAIIIIVGAILVFSPKQEGQKNVKVGYLQLGWAGTEIIDQEDLLAQKGWSAEYTPIPGSPPNLINAYTAGQFDIIDMATVLTAKMYEQGTPLKIIGTGTSGLSAIVVPKNSEIKSLADLKGKKIAAVVGGSTYQDVKTFLKLGYGIDIDNEATVVPATSPPELVNLLKMGEVDAMVGWEPMTSQLVVTGDYQYLAKHQELWEKVCDCKDTFIHVVYLANPKFINSNPAIVSDFNNAQKEAHDIWYNDKNLAMKDIQEVTQLKTDEIEFAMDQTQGVLYGLTEQQKDTIVKYLKIMKDAGVLTSDIWENPEVAKENLFIE